MIERNSVGREHIKPGAVTQIHLATGLLRATTILFQPGNALPFSATWEKVYDDSTVLLYATASGFNAAANAATTMDIKLDGVLVAQTSTWTNEASSHKTHRARWIPFPSSVLSTPTITKGTHTWNVSVSAGAMDANDVVELTAFEIPTI